MIKVSNITLSKYEKSNFLSFLQRRVFENTSSRKDKSWNPNSPMNTSIGTLSGIAVAAGSLLMAANTALKHWGESWLYKPLSMNAAIAVIAALLAKISVPTGKLNKGNKTLSLLQKRIFENKKNKDLYSVTNTSLGRVLGVVTAIGGVLWSVPLLFRDVEKPELFKRLSMHSVLGVLGLAVAAISKPAQILKASDNQSFALDTKLSKVFPLENKIKKNVNREFVRKLGLEKYIHSITMKQMMSMTSNLFIALSAVKLSMPYLTPYVAIPASLGLMHVANKGFKNPARISLTAASAAGLTYLVQNHNLPRTLIRPFMGLLVYMIGSIKNKGGNIKSLMTKDSMLALGKLELLINSIPPLIGMPTKALHKSTTEITNPLIRGIAEIGTICFQSVALGAGFISGGKLFDKALAKYSNKTSACEEVMYVPTFAGGCPLAQAAEAVESVSSSELSHHGYLSIST